MSTTDSKPLEEAIRRRLMHHAGSPGGARAIADATLSTWHQMFALLAPVIGAKGAELLFRRSLYVTSITFRWLTIAGDHEDSTVLIASLKTCLASHETDAAAEASYTLMATFIELLATMIGESLTERLLRSVWVVPVPESEHKQERET